MSLHEATIGQVVTQSNLYSCKADKPIGEVIDEVVKKDFGSVCIVDDSGIPIGIFTERDFLKKIGTLADETIFKEPIENFMTKNPKTVKEGQPLRQCFGLM